MYDLSAGIWPVQSDCAGGRGEPQCWEALAASAIRRKCRVDETKRWGTFRDPRSYASLSLGLCNLPFSVQPRTLPLSSPFPCPPLLVLSLSVCVSVSVSVLLLLSPSLPLKVDLREHLAVLSARQSACSQNKYLILAASATT